jgi:predicted Ser/Thr protein kinase
MPLAKGTRLGPYEILNRIGAGGMGEVYRARDTRIHRIVAVKLSQTRFSERFEREARAIAALNHPNICHLYDVGPDFLVMEFVDGMRVEAGVGVKDTLAIAVQIAEGLAAAHQAGITHRDLKPDNILLMSDGHVKILDFGLAKIRTAHAAASSAETVTMQTESGVVMGTMGYMSPEQVRGLEVDHRSDIFSFGLILYEMLAGRRAFTGETSADIMTATLKDEAPQLPKSVPPLLRDIVARCLEKVPANRFQSAKDLAFALAHSGAAGTSTEAAPTLRRSGVAWAAICAAALVVGGMVALFLLRKTEPLQWSGRMLGGPEIALDPRISPDGHLLAFQVMDRGMTQVALMKPESGNWFMLTHRRDLGSCAQISWSPDGSMIYYARMNSGIFSIPVFGGEERPVLSNAVAVTALPDGSLLAVRGNNGQQLQYHRFWPDTGRQMDLALFSDITTAAGTGRVVAGGKEVIVRALAAGGAQATALFSIDLTSNRVRPVGDGGHSTAVVQAFGVSWDGRSILAARPAEGLTRVVSLPGSGASPGRTLFTSTSEIWYLEGGSAGAVFAGVVDRPTQVVRLTDTGTHPETIAGFPRSVQDAVILALTDGRVLIPVLAAGRPRLMAVEGGKEPLSLIHTDEETSPPMTLAGPGRVAFTIGPPPHRTIALAEIESGRVVGRIAPDKGEIGSLTASPDGATLYFAAGGVIWAVPSSGGESRRIAVGSSAVMRPGGQSLVIERVEPVRVHLFEVPTDGRPEREIVYESSARLMPVPLSPSAIDSRGRLLIPLVPKDSWFNPLAILEIASGRVTQFGASPVNDHTTAAWLPDGRIATTEQGLRAALWKFTPEAR